MNLHPHYSYSFYIKKLVYLLIKKHQTEKTCTTALPQHNNIKELCTNKCTEQTNKETPAQTIPGRPRKIITKWSGREARWGCRNKFAASI